MAILSEGPQRLVAIDLRTGQPRWEFRARAPGTLQTRHAGRVLLVTSGDASIDALDVATGEVVWRFSDRARFSLPPAVAGEVVVAAAGTPGGGRGAMHGIGLYSGRPLWRFELPAAPSAEPIGADDLAVFAYGRSRQARLIGVDAATGQRRWRSADPGLDNGGAALRIDDALCVNTPSGRASLVDLSSGEARWSRALANPLTDDVPRQFTPVLAGGALYVPSAQVHALHPQSGEPLCELDCDLVPDFLHVDARGCVIAEESGHLRAFAPLPVLRLVK
jgi:outer membrane protein assembly factor BamB